ncbi:MAG: dihydropteridine reductase [Porcipelethomonas sp.]
MNKNDQDFIVQKIRSEYMEKTPEARNLEALKELDAHVRRPANIFAYIFGSVSAVIMGSGMSLTMTDIGSGIGIENAMVPGIVIGISGMAMAIVNYPIYRKMLASRKKKYADKIMKLSEKLMNHQ